MAKSGFVPAWMKIQSSDVIESYFDFLENETISFYK
jgi:hypothetical protein